MKKVIHFYLKGQGQMLKQSAQIMLLAISSLMVGGCFAKLEVVASLLPPAPEPETVTSTGYHTCALLPDNTVSCWGYNFNGQLGNGTNTDSSIPVTVAGLTNVRSVSVGYIHSCALLDDGTVSCWGGGYQGALGHGLFANSNTPVKVSGLSNVLSISLGEYHSCALLLDRTVKCWGWNAFGQLGSGNTADSAVPISVSGLSKVRQLSSGSFHSCALLPDNSVKCWGRNETYGQLGDGSNLNRSIPVNVTGISNAMGVSAGGYHSCAILSDNSVKCWGNNTFGQLGDHTVIHRNTPVVVTGLSNVTAVNQGLDHTCAIMTDSTIKCWGRNNAGQLGNGSFLSPSYSPVSVTGISNAKQITMGFFHTCARLADNSVKCWGGNDYGQIGDGTNGSTNVPVNVLGM